MEAGKNNLDITGSYYIVQLFYTNLGYTYVEVHVFLARLERMIFLRRNIMSLD